MSMRRCWSSQVPGCWANVGLILFAPPGRRESVSYAADAVDAPQGTMGGEGMPDIEREVLIGILLPQQFDLLPRE